MPRVVRLRTEADRRQRRCLPVEIIASMAR